MTTWHFIYQNAKGVLSDRTIVNVVDKGDYFQGHCLDSNSKKSFRHDRVVEFVGDKDNLSASLNVWKCNKSSIPSKPHILEIHFTGFREADKSRLSLAAKDAGMLVRHSLSGYLDILCCGYNASPKKIETAQKNQLIIISEIQFLNLLETGELPD